MRKESEICQKPFEKELHALDLLLENSLFSRRDSLNGSAVADVSDAEDELTTSVQNGCHSSAESGIEEALRDEVSTSGCGEQKINGIPLGEIDSISAILNSTSRHPQTADLGSTHESGIDPVSVQQSAAHQHPTPEDLTNTPPGLHDLGHPTQKLSGAIHDTVSHKAIGAIRDVEPPTPPLSSGGDIQPLSNGGIPWYMDPFDPDGTTIEEERWTGRELVRGMSEELSDMDEEELSGLVDGDVADTAQNSGIVTLNPENAGVVASRRKAAAKRKRWRGYR